MSGTTRPEGLAMVLNCAARLARRSIIADADDPTSDQTDTNIVYMAQDLKRSHDQIRDEIDRLRAELAAAHEDADRLDGAVRLLYTALERSSPAEPGHGEQQFRVNAKNTAKDAWLAHAALRAAGES